MLSRISLFSIFCLMLISSMLYATPEAVRTTPGMIPYPWTDDATKAVVRLCESGASPAAFLIDEDEPFAVQRTVEDVRTDLYDVTGLLFPTTNTVPRQSFYPYLIIAGTVDSSKPLKALESSGKISLEGLRGKHESFLLTTVENPFPGCKGAIVIAGSEMRGTIYGLYSLTQDGLGVDPLRFWTEKPVLPKKTLLLTPMSYLEGEPKFKYRGWFLNDEDLLACWHGGVDISPPRSDSTQPNGGISAEIFEPILSAALRLRQNMIIPQTNYSLSQENAQRVVEMVKDRGLLLTTHHAMPLGVWGRDWDIYWQKKGQSDVEFSYIKNKDKFKEVWESGVDSFAPYMGIWQLGLRGKGDDSIWKYDKAFPSDDAGRAKAIKDAVELQRSIVRDKLGADSVPMTTTMWLEVLDLYNKGLLQYPDDLILVVSDWGRGNFNHLEDMGWKEPFPDGRAGVYYHIAFHNSFDSHLVQTVHPERIKEAFDHILKYNMTAYLLVNNSNIRPFLMGTQALSEISWTGKLNPDDFYKRWCIGEYGEKAGPGLIDLYKEQFALPYRWGKLEDEHLMVEGLVTSISRITEGARRGDVSKEMFGEGGTKQIPGYTYRVRWYEGHSLTETIDWSNLHCTEDAAKWEKLYGKMLDLEKDIPEDRKPFYRDSILLQCFTAMNATKALRDVSAGVQVYLKGDTKKAKELVEAGKSELQLILDEQKRTEYGKWTGYYAENRMVNFKTAFNGLDRLLEDIDYQAALRPILGRVNGSIKNGQAELQGFGKPAGAEISIKSGCTAIFNTKTRPEMLSLELSEAPKAPVKVLVNGVEVGTLQGKANQCFLIKNAPTSDKLSVSLHYSSEAEVKSVKEITVYGAKSVRK